MKKKTLSLFLIVGMLVSIFGAGAAVFAYDVEGQATLTRGGSSKYVTSDYKGNSGSWECSLISVSVSGLPAGVIGNNYVVARMRTADGTTSASPTLTYSSSNYQTYLNQTYLSGYGGIGQTYALFSSMPSYSANTGCTATFRFCA